MHLLHLFFSDYLQQLDICYIIPVLKVALQLHSSPTGLNHQTSLKSLNTSSHLLTKYSCDDNASWDMVMAKDLWDDKHVDGKDFVDQDDYVLVKQEDIVDGVACFMATYLLSLKQTKVA
ncbi:hypothetical protein ZIOFF_035676 [Zingiber officinale]|uniref:Uncharacterized protein n=1 Tax=Zingiber officinale TaxID=94328 RepID=A0A8J5L0X1_ZINOF|nr:hypothetical protein ZIOFF_035676 [Zingiber officinale]